MKHKNHKGKRTMSMAVPAPPSREERLKWSVDSLAQTIIETDPAFERTRKQLAERILAVAKRPLIPQPGRTRKR